MKIEQIKKMLHKANASLLVVIMVAVTVATVADALVTSTTTHVVKNSLFNVVNLARKRPRNPPSSCHSQLEAIMTTTEDDTDLLLSLPAMSARAKRRNSYGANGNNNERRKRKRRQKHNETTNPENAPKFNGAKKKFEDKAPTANKRKDICCSDELLNAIPKLSDILEGRTALNDGLDIENKETVENKNNQELKIIRTKPVIRRDRKASTRLVTTNASTAGLNAIIETPNKNKNIYSGNVVSINQQKRSHVAMPSTKASAYPNFNKNRPWRANYKSSKRTQGRIQKAFAESASTHDIHSRSKLILETLLQTPPEYCNVVNLVCALTYSAKAMGHQRLDHIEKNLDFRRTLQETFDILYDLLVVHRDEGLFSPRQLCNVAWAIAKHVDRDPDLLLASPEKEAANDNVELAINTGNDNSDSPQSRLEETIDEIARQLTSILSKHDDIDGDNDSTIDTKLKATKSSFQQPKIKLGEVCMACWAYGKLRPREIPPGWPRPPQVGSVRNPDAIVTDWKTEQLGRSIFGRSFETNKNYEDMDEKQEMNETDDLFDAIGYALCQSSFDEKGDGLANNSSEVALLEDCTWSELANVGWAFASHGRCRSTRSEALLKAIAHEAATRLKDGSIANNHNYQEFLVRDVTQLLWSLGTLQSDNFRLADDLILLTESLTSNLRLGTKMRSRFAQGRPLRRWSCADLVQTAVALAHARIDENLLLRAIYEEGNYRLMEGASSSRNQSSLASLPSEKRKGSNLPLGEDRRALHPWEASILLWSQARLHLTEQEGIEFDEFAEDAPLFFLKALHESRGSFVHSRIGPQEQANIVWSLVILEKYDSPEAIILIGLIFAEASRSCKENKGMQLEHAHQLWQAYFILEEDCPEAVKRVPNWFVSYLKEKWNLEKARLKLSSARHQSLSSTLQLMGVDHINEHDEDIDVAIILQPNAVWVHQTDMDEVGLNKLGNDEEDHVSVAVEFDGPNHFTRVHKDSLTQPPRALGHTVLKYRLLKKQGWTVVRVPYYEFDKIPFWASMERQRYLQRKLKTHANIQFSEVDVSEYKTLMPNRRSRFD